VWSEINICMPRAKKSRLMAQLRLFEVPKRPRVAPAAILAASLVIGLVLGGVIVDTIFRELVRPVVGLGVGERPERSTTIVAVREDGEVAVLTKLTVELIENGRGRTLLSIDPTYFERDTQNSAENAREAVHRYYYNLDNLDVLFIFESQEELIIRGPSAGAAMAVALYALAKSRVENRVWVVDNTAVVSGRITEDGRVLPIGQVELKAQKVKEEGFGRFVVSWEQRRDSPPYDYFTSYPGLDIVRVRDMDELVSAEKQIVVENVG